MKMSSEHVFIFNLPFCSQITKTPYGTSVHVYLDEGPFNDPDLYPIMIYAGFSSKDKKLVYTSPDDTEADILASASVVLAAFSTK